MTWRANLRPGSFRGVPFLIDGEAEGEVGRRTVKREYPLRDTPSFDDLGRRARGMKLECLVLGDSYMSQRDALLQAFEAPGSGKLVHPYWGEFNVVVDGAVRVRESVNEGGVARFSLSVFEVGATKFPVVRVDSGAGLTTAASRAAGALVVAKGSVLSVAQQPEWVVESVVKWARKAADEVRSLRSKALGYLDDVEGTVAAIERFAADVEDLAFTPAELVSRLVELVKGIIGLADAAAAAVPSSAVQGSDSSGGTIPSGSAGYLPPAGTSSAGAQAEPSVLVLSGVLLAPADVARVLVAVAEARANAVGALVGMRTLATFGDDDPGVTPETPSREQEQANRTALVTVVQAAAVIQACAAAATAPFQTRDDALAVRDELVERIDALAEDGDEVLYGALVDLRAAVVAHLTAVSTRRLQVVTPPATLPALVLAYQLHGDARREAELVARNHVAYPGFVPGGKPVEVALNG
jgi:prophage DNA circulation protein